MYFKSSNNGFCQKAFGKMVKNKRDLTPRRRSLLARQGARKAAGSHSNSANIKVVVRVRPPSQKEEGANGRIVVKVIDEQMLIFDPEEEHEPFFYHGVQQKGRDLLKKPKKNMQFTFDRVFGFEEDNNDVFLESTEQLIDKLMEGCNCSVFVYGATGAGKTHTMLGHTENPGITFLTMKSLFERKETLIQEWKFELAVTYLEVYNENVQDLLNPGSSLFLREDGKIGIIVSGLQIKKINSAEQLFDLLEQGNRNRTQHPTDANAESSRSHAVFQVYLHMTNKLTQQVRMAKFSMIDLAGSERAAATGCVGQRFKEGANINKSLLALGNCINSLADGKGHIPYRDSKLTRLLKDSLGGNCQTVMIANISPSSLAYEDTYNTLKYATRAKKIKSCVRKNVTTGDKNAEKYLVMIESLKAEIEQLNGKLLEAESRTSITGPCPTCKTTYKDEDKIKLLELVEELKKLLDRLHQLEFLEYALDLRRQLKEAADTRLSGLCVDSVDKVKGHKRLGATIYRMSKQLSSVKDEIYHCKEKKKEMYKNIDEFLENNPELTTIGGIEKAKLEQLEAHYQAEVQKKKHEKVAVELKSQGELLMKISTLLRTCYLQLKGQNRVPESVENSYKSLLSDWQGVQNVTFDISFDDTIPVASGDDNRKRKLVEIESSTSLNTETSLCSKPRPPLPVSAKQFLSKAATPIRPPKKVAKISPKKENKAPRKLMATMGTSERYRATKTPSTSRQPLK